MTRAIWIMMVAGAVLASCDRSVDEPAAARSAGQSVTTPEAGSLLAAIEPPIHDCSAICRGFNWSTKGLKHSWYNWLYMYSCSYTYTYP